MIVFRSDVTVIINDECTVGSDAATARAARVVRPGPPIENAGRTVRTCLPLHHTSPFEHGLMSVYVEAPGVVWWQLTRQRFMSLDSEDFSFNVESGRYRVLEPEFYLPPAGRPILEPPDFRPMRPKLATDPASCEDVAVALRAQFRSAWDAYRAQIERGVSREVARLLLPNWALYCDGYVTARPLSWLQFFAKRVSAPETAVPTYPQWETEEFARNCEAVFSAQWPETHAAFVANGRRAT